GLRRGLHDVRHALHAGDRLHPHANRACANRHALLAVVHPPAEPDRRHRLLLLLLPRDDPPVLLRLAGGLSLVPDRGDLGREPLAAHRLAVQVRHPLHRAVPAHPGDRGAPQEPVRHPDRPRVGPSRADGDRMSPELLGAIMLVLMLGAIFIGFPISFTLLLLALIFGWVGLGDRAFYIMVFQTIGLMKEEVLAAVPLFIFMGYLMEQGGLMERLFKGFQLMMGPVPGSLYVGVLITATIFGIAAGTVGATVVLMGIMAVPIMTKAGYNIPMSAGAITAGGTLGILVPPSVMLVVMG